MDKKEMDWSERQYEETLTKAELKIKRDNDRVFDMLNEVSDLAGKAGTLSVPEIRRRLRALKDTLEENLRLIDSND